MATAGLGSGLDNLDQAKNQALQRSINYQSQTPYASKNGMNTGGIKAPAPKPSPAQHQATSTASGQSPVMANGRISQNNAPSPQPQVPMSAPVAQSQMPAPQAGAAPAAPAPATPVQTAYQQNAPYTMGAQGNQNTVAYNNPLGPQRWSDTLYTPGQLTQNQGILTPQMEGLVQGALQGAIQGGGGLPVEQLKGRARDDALAMRGNDISSLDDAMAARGRGNSGWAAGQGQNIRSAATSDILGKYRDIDVADAQSRLENQYKGIQAGSDYLAGQSQRNLADWTATHQGEMDQEDLLQKGAANSRENYLADIQGAAANKSADVSLAGAQAGADASKYGARLGLTSDLLRIMEQARQSDQQTGLGWGGVMSGLMGRI
jgi:hypothetical protein